MSIFDDIALFQNIDSSIYNSQLKAANFQVSFSIKDLVLKNISTYIVVLRKLVWIGITLQMKQKRF